MSTNTNHYMVSKRLVSSILIIIAVLLVVSVVGGGQTDQPEWVDEVFSKLEVIVEEYNEAQINLGLFESVLHNQNVNLHVSAADGSQATYSFRIDKQGRIVDLERGERADASLRMITTRQTIQDIEGSKDRPAAFRRAVREKDIRFVGIGFLNRIVIAVVMFIIQKPLLAAGTATVAGATIVYVAAKVGIEGILSALSQVLDKLIAIMDQLIELLTKVGVILGLVTTLLKTVIDGLESAWNWLKQKARAARNAVYRVLFRRGD